MVNTYYDDDIDSSYELEHRNQYQYHDTENNLSSEDEDIENHNLPQPMYELPNDHREEETEEIEHTMLRIGEASLIISSNGIIRNLKDIFSASMGYALIGTPYRTYIVEIEKNICEEYFVHDLVWRAFNGEPPEGWEVRHKYWETKRGAEMYDNSLDILDIYPSTVVYLPYVRKCLPVAQ